MCAGHISSAAMDLAVEHGIDIIDYYNREELMIANAVSTAEGAVQLAMEETAITLNGSKCLVIGYGRIGKILAHRLKALGANVTVSARNYADKAWINAFGYKYADTRQLESCLENFDIVINTVPARVLGKDRLELLHAGSLCMDLASKPGGMDFNAAAGLGIKAIWALSLPGEVAPESSGAVIRDTIYNILHEQEFKL